MPCPRSSNIVNTLSRRILTLSSVPAVEIGGKTAWTR